MEGAGRRNIGAAGTVVSFFIRRAFSCGCWCWKLIVAVDPWFGVFFRRRNSGDGLDLEFMGLRFEFAVFFVDRPVLARLFAQQNGRDVCFRLSLSHGWHCSSL